MVKPYWTRHFNETGLPGSEGDLGNNVASQDQRNEAGWGLIRNRETLGQECKDIGNICDVAMGCACPIQGGGAMSPKLAIPLHNGTPTVCLVGNNCAKGFGVWGF
jgi:hypothetical protein